MRVTSGVYVSAGPDEDVRSRVRHHWQLFAERLVCDAVVAFGVKAGWATSPKTRHGQAAPCSELTELWL